MGKELIINEKTKIYICCPCFVTTGGPEALHQLYYYMKTIGLNCYLTYIYSCASDQVKIADRYSIYAKEYMLYEDIEDSADNVIIMPESMSIKLLGFFNIQKCIWWLGLLAADSIRKHDGLIVSLIKDILKPLNGYSRFKTIRKLIAYKKNKNRFKDVRVHLAGSKFAWEYLKKQGYNNVEYLVEPISSQFLTDGCFSSNSQMRNDVILYNPAKNLKIVKKLQKNKMLKFLPLKGYDCNGLINLYRTSKLYIDFGGFPGPERIPKEAVYNGCAILVGRENASVNDFDIAIPEKYKLAKGVKTRQIIENIEYILSNFDEIINDFLPFQKKVDNLEENFTSQIASIFKQ